MGSEQIGQETNGPRSALEEYARRLRKELEGVDREILHGQRAATVVSATASSRTRAHSASGSSEPRRAAAVRRE